MHARLQPLIEHNLTKSRASAVMQLNKERAALLQVGVECRATQQQVRLFSEKLNVLTKALAQRYSTGAQWEDAQLQLTAKMTQQAQAVQDDLTSALHAAAQAESNHLSTVRDLEAQVNALVRQIDQEQRLSQFTKQQCHLTQERHNQLKAAFDREEENGDETSQDGPSRLRRREAKVAGGVQQGRSGYQGVASQRGQAARPANRSVDDASARRCVAPTQDGQTEIDSIAECD